MLSSDINEDTDNTDGHESDDDDDGADSDGCEGDGCIVSRQLGVATHKVDEDNTCNVVIILPSPAGSPRPSPPGLRQQTSELSLAVRTRPPTRPRLVISHPFYSQFKDLFAD